MKVKNMFQYVYAIYMFDFVLVACSNLQSEIANLFHTSIHVITVVGMVGIIIQKNIFCSVKKIIKLSVIALLLLVIFKLSGTDYFLIAFLFIVASEGQDFRKLIDITLQTVIIAGLFVIGLKSLGIIEDVVINGARHSLGFYHPNMLGALAIEIICLWGAKRYDKFKVYDGIGMALFAYMINYFTKNKSCLGATAVLIVCVFLFKFRKTANRTTKVAKWISKTIVPLCCTISIVGCYLYAGKGLLLWMNRILTNRFLYGNLFLKKYPISLLGQRVLITSTQSTELNDIPAQPLDNAYVNILIINGAVIFFLFCLFYHKTIQKLFEEKKYSLVIASCVYVVYGILETYAYRYGFNFTILAFSMLLSSRPKMEKSYAYNKLIIRRKEPKAEI